MNENDYLIFIYSSKNNEWQDSTKNIESYKKYDKYYSVKFNNYNSLYNISNSKIIVYDESIEISFQEVYYKNALCMNIDKILLFNNKIYKLFYKNGFNFIARKNDIKINDIINNKKGKTDIIAYYRSVILENIKNDEDRFMFNQFDSINNIDCDSVLYYYLNQKILKYKNNLEMPVICPFGTNLSQLKALKMAFENKISIIEGPPGTGKTQTILNIISNAVIRNKSVAIVSNNNSAIKNIYDKLEKNGYSFICAMLGNKNNVDNFFENFNSNIPNLDYLDVDIHKLNNLYLGLPSYFEKANNKKKLLNQIESLNLEYKHFIKDNIPFDFNKYKIKKYDISLNDIKNQIFKLKEKGYYNFFERIIIKRKFKFKINIFKEDKNKELLLLQNIYYLVKINSLEKQIKEIDDYMNNESFEYKMSLYKDNSNKYLNNILFNRYKDKRSNYSLTNYKINFSNFIKDYPVILSSSYSLAKCSKKNFIFDYLIIDESSQANMASAILSMQLAKNLIVVGDLKQLPQIDDSNFYLRNKELLKKYNVPDAYSYYGNNIMSSLLLLFGNEIPKTILKEHYRCSYEIINFCNKEFYNDELIIYNNTKNNDISMKVIKTVPGNFARKNPEGTGLYNQREIDEIEKILNTEELEDIGIITPYKQQAKFIQEKFGDRVEASTVHKFQGREKKTIIFSSVVNDSNEFVDNDNLINVSVSRAINKFILVTSDKVFNSKTGVLADLINYISYHKDFGKVDNGTIKSIYDILYNDYEKELQEFRKKYPSNNYDTENLTYNLLNTILKDEIYNSLTFKMHVSLRDFIKNNKFTKEEFKFYINPKSHVDFLIYNKMSKKPICAIEVDGIYYHEQQEKQKARDLKKESILKKSNISLLRLKTNQSNEEARIKEFINQALK